jgi:integrase/recombinase XerD
MDSLVGLQPATQARTINAIKSLFAFALRIGYLGYNVAAAVRAPSVRETLSERILSEADVHRMLALEENPRNRVMLRVLYAGGLRVSELCDLTWKDVTPRDQGTGQVSVYGKGQKTRHILLPASVWADLFTGKEVNVDAPVFASRKTGGRLSRQQVHHIVKAAAIRAGLSSSVSPHFLRHAAASHALDRGCPIHVVQQTLGHASLTTTSQYVHARPGDSAGMYLAL